MYPEHAMGKMFCGGCCKRQLDAALKQDKRVLVGKGENNVHSQELTRLHNVMACQAFCHNTSPGKSHPAHRNSLISAQ